MSVVAMESWEPQWSQGDAPLAWVPRGPNRHTLGGEQHGQTQLPAWVAIGEHHEETVLQPNQFDQVTVHHDAYVYRQLR